MQFRLRLFHQLDDSGLRSVTAADAGANDAGVAAVAFCVAETVRSAAPMVVLSTASPYKFPRDVLAALGETAPESDFAAMAALNVKTGCPVPASLGVLNTLPVRFNTVIEPAAIRDAALK